MKLKILIVLLSFICTSFSFSKALKEKPFVVIVCSYNNSRWYHKNLDSIVNQDYKNYRVVYVDDASTDGTANLVSEYVKQKDLDGKFTLIKNKERQRKSKNLYNIYHSVKDEEIIVQVDGDDWLAHPNVLKKLNEIYTKEDIWITYGQYKNSKSGSIGYCKNVPPSLAEKRQFRRKWLYMPTRSFYGWLFKLIKLEDFLSSDVDGFEGKFYPVGNDQILMYSMLEMASRHFKFTPEISYIRNTENPISGYKIERPYRKQCRKEIFSPSPRYANVNKPIINRLNKYKNAKADILLFSHSFKKTLKLLNFFKSKIVNTNLCYILFSSQKEDKYKYLENKFKDIKCINLYKLKQSELLSVLFPIFNKLNPSHIVIGNDLINLDLIKNPKKIDLNECIQFLEKTFAYNLDLTFDIKNTKVLKKNKAIYKYEHIYKNFYAYKLNSIKDTNNLSLVLYRAKKLYYLIEELDNITLNSLEIKYSSIKYPEKGIGIFYKTI